MNKLYIMPMRLIAGIALLCFMILSSCNNDRSELIIDTWEMEDDNYSVEFKADNKYVFKDGTNAITGTWKLSEDGKALILTEEDYGEKVVEVKRLNKRKLILDDAGTRMRFKRLEEEDAF